ncbi:uncharacterized protein TNCV_1114621 [Trichonephila clavipes]|nr:uncharacterized protein TNCV_1114621 [Trichonephila clavipes]
MHNRHKWVQVIRQDTYVPVICQESYIDVSEVPCHANCTRPIPSQSTHQLEQSPVDMSGSWIHEVVSIPVHVHQLYSIGNETRQTRQHVSRHQQFNVGVDGPRRGLRLCVVLSTRIHEWAFASESPYHRDINFNELVAL